MVIEFGATVHFTKRNRKNPKHLDQGETLNRSPT